MKLAIRTVVFHMSCIFLFSIIYSYFSNDFDFNSGNSKEHKDFIDFFLLSTTVQAGVGVTGLYPVSCYSKFAMILQQILMLVTHVFTIYVFTV
jgi:hypothetical protein